MDRLGWGAGGRRYGVAAGVVVLALVAGGVVAARDDRRDPSALTQLDTDPDLAPVDPSGSPTPTPTPVATAGATASTSGATTATARPGDPLPTVVPTGRPTVVPTGVPTNGPTSPLPTPSAEPLVHVSVTDSDLPTATKMLVTVRWRNRPGYYVEVDPGDGHAPWTTDACYRHEREDVTYGAEWAIARYEWSYRRAGTYRITAKLLQYPCHDGSIETIATAAPRQVRVTLGAVASNGPWLPHLETSVTDEDPPNLTDPAPPRRVWASIGAWDSDGWSWKYTIDWGDGSDTESHGMIENCWIDPDDTGTKHPYPDSTWPWGGLSGGQYDHDMPAAGTYTVTVTAYSSDCDANDVQTTTRQMTITVA